MKVTVHVNSVDFIIYDKRWPVYRSSGRSNGESGEEGEEGEEGSVHRRDKRLNTQTAR